MSASTGFALLDRSRILGWLSAFFFCCAALAVVDALQTLIRMEFNSVDLLPGESVEISGMLPAEAAGHEDLQVLGTGNGVSFSPIESYKGFWMGGRMWRGAISASPRAAPGKVTIIIEDLLPASPQAPGAGTQPGDMQSGGVKPAGAGRNASSAAVATGSEPQKTAEKPANEEQGIDAEPQMRQNPALIYQVTIWPSEAARRAADPSLARRLTGLPAYGVGVISLGLALLCGLANWRAFSRAERLLAEHGVFIIHGTKVLPGQGMQVAFAHSGTRNFGAGEPVLLLDRRRRPQGEGHVTEADGYKAHAVFPEGTRLRYGWLVERTRPDIRK